MTIKERVEKLRCLITCMKCKVSGKECDNNCSTQYDAGNMGEIIENLEEIAKALEQELCEDCINRQTVLDKLNRLIEVERLQGTDEMGYGRERVSAYENMIFEISSKYLYPSVIPQPKADVLDKIRTEIAEFEEEVFHRTEDYSDYAAVRYCLEIIDKYRAESEG